MCSSHENSHFGLITQRILSSVRSMSDMTFLQPGLDQLKLLSLSFEGEDNICAACSCQPFTRRTGLQQTEHVLFSLPYPGYLQQSRDNGGLLIIWTLCS